MRFYHFVWLYYVVYCLYIIFWSGDLCSIICRLEPATILKSELVPISFPHPHVVSNFTQGTKLGIHFLLISLKTVNVIWLSLHTSNGKTQTVELWGDGATVNAVRKKRGTKWHLKPFEYQEPHWKTMWNHPFHLKE